MLTRGAYWALSLPVVCGFCLKVKDLEQIKMPGKAYLPVDLSPAPTINFAVCAVGAEFSKPGSGISKAKILYWVDSICTDKFY